MRKWKRGSRLNLNNSIKDDKGFTLVELLASLALLSIVILLAGSVHMFGQRQFIAQSTSTNTSNDLSYALSVMSRELRSTPADTVSIDSEKSSILVNGTSVFQLNGNNQLLNDKSQVIAENVETFQLIKESDTIEIKLTSLRDKNGQSKEYQTTIYFRR